MDPMIITGGGGAYGVLLLLLILWSLAIRARRAPRMFPEWMRAKGSVDEEFMLKVKVSELAL